MRTFLAALGLAIVTSATSASAVEPKLHVTSATLTDFTITGFDWSSTDAHLRSSHDYTWGGISEVDFTDLTGQESTSFPGFVSEIDWGAKELRVSADSRSSSKHYKAGYNVEALAHTWVAVAPGQSISVAATSFLDMNVNDVNEISPSYYPQVTANLQMSAYAGPSFDSRRLSSVHDESRLQTDHAETLSDRLTLSYTNASRQTQYLYVEAGVFGSGSTMWYPAPPVPEPETYALLIVGLAALGWRARTRRGNPAATPELATA
ncbi:PEP-CTERM sorting domain-containing protein [Caldimonas brevitalea]|uniref:Ice-binding protein C-terminal domain-containing protein n=1 Tax=Caldimonas brevitalea TaxID=413882 RepID=A0A0G3BP75_9BURK|nr:PEP-CTERM sorting domain-containing protein [Caldimonas brevitalea]AKJ28345.1 hypothetical protein AAW51_1654 [Caldimonas brevitalea]